MAPLRDDPPELKALMAGASAQEREALLRAFHTLAQGDPDSAVVQLALFSRVVASMSQQTLVQLNQAVANTGKLVEQNREARATFAAAAEERINALGQALEAAARFPQEARNFLTEADKTRAEMQRLTNSNTWNNRIGNILMIALSLILSTLGGAVLGAMRFEHRQVNQMREDIWLTWGLRDDDAIERIREIVREEDQERKGRESQKAR